MTTLKNDQAKRGTARVIRPNGEEYLLPLVMPRPPEGEEPTPVSVSRVGAFPEKVITGDFSRFSHPWLSAFVQADWSGGGQIRDSQEATDISRYWWGTLESRYPKQLSLPPYVGTIELAGNASGCVVVGDLTANGSTRLFVAYGTAMRVVEDDNTLSTPVLLSASPVATGVAFRGSAHTTKRLFIPHGTSGYDILDPATDTLVGISTTVKPLNFVEWNKNLWCIESTGKIWRNATGDNAGWTLMLQLDGDGEARSLQRYYDQSGAPLLFAITSRDVQAIAIADDEAYVTSLEYSPHRYAGYAACRWREWLAVSYGVDVARYDGGTISYVGLARDHGLPAEMRGGIKAMAPGWNDLFVLIEGTSVAGSSTGHLETDVDGDLLVTRSSAQSAVMRLDSLGGWHPLWVSSATGKSVTNIAVSAAGGDTRLFWGFGSKLYFSDLAEAFQNPAENPDAVFATSGTIMSPWLDMNNTGMEMVLACIDLRHKHCDANTKIRVYYQINDDDLTNTWRLAAEIDGPPDDNGRTRIKTGTAITLPNGESGENGGIGYTGFVFKRLRYRLDFVYQNGAADSTTVSPLVESISIVYMPKMGTYLSYNFTVDCTHGPFNGLGNRDMQALITTLIEDEFCFLNYRGNEWITVKFSGAGGADESNRFAGDRTLSAVSVFEMEL